MARAMTKLGARDRAQLVVIACEPGLVQAGLGEDGVTPGPAAGPCRKRHGDVKDRRGASGRRGGIVPAAGNFT